LLAFWALEFSSSALYYVPFTNGGIFKVLSKPATVFTISGFPWIDLSEFILHRSELVDL